MQRKEFIKQCGFACLGMTGFAAIAESCISSKSLSGTVDADKKLHVPLSAFNGRNGKYESYVMIRNDELNYPIIVYRNSDTDYKALLLKCTHQYNELSVAGDLLTCPAHGSSFNRNGDVVNGPAEMKLRAFTTSIADHKLFIHLA